MLCAVTGARARRLFVPRSSPVVLLAAALGLAGCASTAHTPLAMAPHGAPPPTRARAQAAPKPANPAESFASLAGWASEDHVAALAAFAAACGASRDRAMRAVCARSRALHGVPEGAARAFFEFNFRPESIDGEGVLTAYFAPEYEARSLPEGAFTAPVRPPPHFTPSPEPPAAPPQAASDDPVDALLAPAAEPAPAVATPGAARATLARSAAADALAWMRPEDLFFLQIQGSGVLDFPDGRRLKATYAADNGQPFVAIARPMVAQGLLAADRVSGEAIRAWLAANAGPRADAVMNLDPRYVFFALAPDDGRDPAGAAGVPLPPGRALAVDPSRHAFGELYWIDAEAPVLTGAVRRYRGLALALDTGSAIRGEVRADLYLGRGAQAGREAGRVRHRLRLVRLVPVGDDG